MTSPGGGQPIFEGFERKSGEPYITVGQLLDGMTEADLNMAMVASDDEEGNDFRPMAGIRQGLYLPRRAWFGEFYVPPDDSSTMDARMLYERAVANNVDAVEATLLASVDPGQRVDEVLKWGDFIEDLQSTTPESVTILRHHTHAELFDNLPTYSPLTEVELAHYLPDAGIEYEGTSLTIPFERIVSRDEYDDEEERQLVEEALKHPNTRPAYFFWPLN